MAGTFVIRWKVVAIAGGGAFALSFLLGLISGNYFLVAFFRALLFGAIFAVLGGGSAFLLDRFAKDVFTSTSGSVSSRGDGETESVNILIDEESPESDSGLEELSGEEQPLSDDNSSAALTAGGLFEADGQSDLDGEDLDAEEGSDSSIEMTADMPSGTEDDSPQTRETFAQVSAAPPDLLNKQEREPEESQNFDLGLESKDKKTTDQRPSSEDIDVLPDMSAFESSFSPVTGGANGNDDVPFDGFENTSLKTTRTDQDPVTYAKALRTIIKRDEGKKK